MNDFQNKHFKQILAHLYINPLEKCNLRCKICYTKKTSFILSKKQILNFINRYIKEIELKVITFCGGEVFTLPYMIQFINELNHKGIFIQIITNGTIDKLAGIKNPNLVNLIVSLDGLQKHHESNRGQGNFQKSLDFIKKAIKFGFHTEIFSVITKQNLPTIAQFEKYLFQQIGKILITYHPRKPLSYLRQHPLSNIIGKINNFTFLSQKELHHLMEKKTTFPPKNLGCYQISLMSDGKIYGCCESFEPIGDINTSIKRLIEKLKNNIKGPCLGCSQAEFMCGIKKVISNFKDQGTKLN